VAEMWSSDLASSRSLRSTTERTYDNSICGARPQRRVMPDSESTGAIRFAHPAEAVVAQLFDSFGVRWSYEPTTFPLVIARDGRPIRCFTPDFFLPDHHLYVEMTTMRQSLVTRKNRKFRMMREIFPELDVRLLYRKDVELIVDRYGAHHPVVEDEVGPVVASGDQIRRKAQEIAARIGGAGDSSVALIAVGQGAERFRDLIACELDRSHSSSVSVATIAVTPSDTLAGSMGAAIHLDSRTRLGHHRRILVADVVGTGLTCWAAQTWLDGEGLAVDSVVSLLDRRSARLIDVPLLIPALAAPSNWIVGAGMGRADHLQLLPDLHAVRPGPITASSNGA
jgi:hypoxanthine-guanine phosphoribosyltransferase